MDWHPQQGGITLANNIVEPSPAALLQHILGQHHDTSVRIWIGKEIERDRVHIGLFELEDGQKALQASSSAERERAAGI